MGLMKSLNETQIQGQPSPLSLVNSVWVNESCELNPKFQEVANSIFNAHVQAVDFDHKANEVRLMVNEWVESKTSGIIKNLVPEGSFDRTTMVVLVNALYFKGVWHQVPYMSSTEEYQYIACQNGFKVLKLPYQLQKQTASRGENDNPFDDDDMFDDSAQRFSMYIVLPDSRDGLGELIDKANNSAGFLHQCVPNYMPLKRTGEFKVPKFKITFEFDAKRVLKDMGLVLPFSFPSRID
ncbi:serpin-Z7-like [Papaver somniferum]|uniref:serpin-Z7-like n=1 Tax=Papaver somniferum TaxID=3469 RepID=UPI000E6FBFCE|nr:serpin-Z7-like [Papaver somniferum]